MPEPLIYGYECVWFEYDADDRRHDTINVRNSVWLDACRHIVIKLRK